MTPFLRPAAFLLALAILPSAAVTPPTELFDITSYKGKVVYLDFWASWCSPCRQSFPFMNELATKFKDQGLAVVSINVDTDPQKAAEFLDAIPPKFDVIYDQEGDLAKAYSLKAMPTSLLFDRDGKLIDSHLGFKKKDIKKLTSAIQTLLEKQ